MGLTLGIIGSLLICIVLYIGVCLVITGMVPYTSLGEDAPLAKAFTSRGLKYVSVIISVVAIAGLTTTLLVGLHVQSRLYLGLGRMVYCLRYLLKYTQHATLQFIPQVWVGIIAIDLAGLFNVQVLSHILSAGSLVYTDPPGFSCPWVPVVPAVCILFNMFLFVQLHHEAWVRFVILSIIPVGIYAAYGQYHESCKFQ